MWPSASTATHSVEDWHETALMKSVPAIGSTVQAAEDPAGVPAPGSVDVAAFPSPSTATHSAVDGHETALRKTVPATGSAVHVAADPAGDPAIGLVEVTTVPGAPAVVPGAPTATHSELDAHDTPNREVVTTFWTVQVAADPAGEPAVGLVEVTTLPALSTATQTDAVGSQETPKKK